MNRLGSRLSVNLICRRTAPSIRTMSLQSQRKLPPTQQSLDQLASDGWSVIGLTLPDPDLASASSGAPVEGKAERLKRDFKFKDFNAAWGFMSRVALVAEKLDVSRFMF